MAKRFTEIDKWKDAWFLDLSPYAKVMFLYLCDRCDIAGFYERHDKTISFYTGIEQDKIESALKELEKSAIFCNGTIWLKNFIRHQKNLPINPENNCHKGILKLLDYQSKNFSQYYEEVVGINLDQLNSLLGADKGLFSPIGKGKGKGKGKGMDKGVVRGFIKPTIQEIEDYAKSIGFQLDAQYWFDWYETRGWKYKGNIPMKDWKAGVRNWKKGGNYAGKTNSQPRPTQGKYDNVEKV